MAKDGIRITNIALDDETPASITITIPVDLAAQLAVHCGRQSESNAAEGIHALYDALVGGVFNRFWENGVNDYLAGRETS